MKIPKEIPIYGDTNYRNKKCPLESIEQITFVNFVRNNYPSSYGLLILHPKNEGKLINGQFQAINKDKAMGMAPGASDIIIPGNPSLVCEMKRKDHTKSKIHQEEIEYLLAAQQCGAFACVALGHDGALEAFNDWLKIIKNNC